MKSMLACLFLFMTHLGFCQDNKTINEIDTLKFAVLKHSDFFPDSLITHLSTEELVLAEDIFQKAAHSYNNELRKLSTCSDTIIPRSIKCQFTPSIQNGEKIISVNCFYANKDEFPYWHVNEVVVFDRGGFVHLTINLTKKDYSNFNVSQSVFRKMKIIQPIKTGFNVSSIEL